MSFVIIVHLISLTHPARSSCLGLSMGRWWASSIKGRSCDIALQRRRRYDEQVVLDKF